MRRLSVTDVRKIEVAPFDVGDLPEDGILVQNEYTAVSVGTEIYVWTQGSEPMGQLRFPRPTGYCNIGRVIEVGSDVTDVKPGDRVAGQGNHASHSILRGFYQKVPDGLSPKSAAFMVMGAIAIHGIRIARVELGESVVVTGLGIVGQLAATLAKLSGGLPVIGIDLNDFRLGVAKARGIDVCINPQQVDDLPDAVRQHTVEDGANCVVEATGIASVYPMALPLACMGGRLVALGSARGSVDISFLDDIHLREVTVLGAHQPKTPNEDHIYHRFSKNRERALVIQLMADGKLPVEDLITHVAQPEECQSIYDMLADNPHESLGVLFDWTSSS